MTKEALCQLNAVRRVFSIAGNGTLLLLDIPNFQNHDLNLKKKPQGKRIKQTTLRDVAECKILAKTLSSIPG